MNRSIIERNLNNSIAQLIVQGKEQSREMDQVALKTRNQLMESGLGVKKADEVVLSHTVSLLNRQAHKSIDSLLLSSKPPEPEWKQEAIRQFGQKVEEVLGENVSEEHIEELEKAYGKSLATLTDNGEDKKKAKETLEKEIGDRIDEDQADHLIFEIHLKRLERRWGPTGGERFTPG